MEVLDAFFGRLVINQACPLEMNLSFGQRNTHAQHATLATLEDADRDQDGAVTHAAAVTDFLVPRVQDDVRNRS